MAHFSCVILAIYSLSLLPSSLDFNHYENQTIPCKSTQLLLHIVVNLLKLIVPSFCGVDLKTRLKFSLYNSN